MGEEETGTQKAVKREQESGAMQPQGAGDAGKDKRQERIVSSGSGGKRHLGDASTHTSALRT